MSIGAPKDQSVVTPEPSSGDSSFDHTEIKGRFNKGFTSGYWTLALPALAARYVFRYVERLVGIDDSPKLNRFYPVAVGSWMAAITSFYALRTYADMKQVFSETIAYEFDKKPEDVGIRDFFKSKNAIVHTTLRNFVKRSSLRGAVAASFFTFLLPWKPFKNPKADPVDLGTGVAGAYLVSDAFFGRTESGFEALQRFIDTKINHNSGNVGEIITDLDLMNLYAIHARDHKLGHLVSGAMDTTEWHNDRMIFSRMADLMNQTYHNIPNKEQAKFTVPKFLYLLGNNLITTENRQLSLAFIEIANRYDIPALKEVVKAIKNGSSLDEMLQKYPIPLPNSQAVEPSPPERQFTAAVPAPRSNERAKPMAGSFAELAKRPRVDAEPQLSQSA